MSKLIEIEFLKKDKFYFKKLNWIEESELKFSKELPRTKAYLAASLVKINDLEVTYEQAEKIMRNVPYALAERLYILYQGKHEDRKIFRLKEELYKAPEFKEIKKRILDEEDTQEETLDSVKYDEESLEIIKNSGLKGAIPYSQSEESKQ